MKYQFEVGSVWFNTSTNDAFVKYDDHWHYCGKYENYFPGSIRLLTDIWKDVDRQCSDKCIYEDIKQS